MENDMSDIFSLGQNQYHSTGVKKSYFGHSFNLRQKKVFWWVKSDFSFSLSPFLNFYTHRHKMDTELDNIFITFWDPVRPKSDKIIFFEAFP